MRFWLLMVLSLLGLAVALALADGTFMTCPMMRAPLTVASGPNYWTDPNAANLVLRYWFDPTALGADGQIEDSSGNNNDSTNSPSVAAGPTWTVVGTNVNGRVENGYSFDNSDDYMFTWNAGLYIYGILSNAPAYTICCWVWITNPQTLDGIWSTRSTSVKTLYVNASKQLYHYTGVGDYNTGPIVYLSNWLHIACCFVPGTTNQIFTNGVFATGSKPATTNISINSWWQIGYDTSGRYYSGLIDDVRFYNVQISAADLVTLVSNTHPTNNLEAR